ncbi:MAG: hypothetical protein SGJ27_22815 [Candidatus Melainabacteria bacterium]|nr:hypothetical protein [Candidatus Melainabacteria bacterium]
MTGRPTDELLSLAEVEDNNFDANVRLLPDVLFAFDELFRLHATFTSLIESSISDLGETAYVAVSNFCQLIAQDLLKGMCNLCKGYLTDATFHTRRAVEAAASLIEVVKKPEKAQIWSLMAADEQIAKYVKTFATYKLVKSNLSAVVVKQYETHCLSVHPSALSMAHRTKFSESGTWSIRFFDVETIQDIPQLKRAILNLLTTHRLILDDMAAVFETSPSFDSEHYNAASKRVFAIWREVVETLLESGEISFDEPDSEPSEWA